MESGASRQVAAPFEEEILNNYAPLESLRGILESQTHLFTCGGAIALRSPDRPSAAASGLGQVGQGHECLTIRWDAANFTGDQHLSGSKLSLPLVAGHEASLDHLLQHCGKATFGRGGLDVYDETYRKAVQMSPQRFCTNFDPYSAGILDIIAQVLLPTAIESTTHRAVHAELYKLNIYSSPSGRFKTHVDTPRSPFQFGSLVVCLPLEHLGGQLKVRHRNEEMTFDWSNSRCNPDHGNIRWAAFYSDCEHEVLEVTAGHRLTLTYNLYAVQGAGRMTGVSRTLNPANLPLFHAIKAALYRNPFQGKGGTLGFWCSHVYAYNSEMETPLPEALKGVDAMLWAIFEALGLRPHIAPMTQVSEDIREDFMETHDKPLAEFAIGRQFGVHVHEPRLESADDYVDMFRQWGRLRTDSIYWLTKPVAEELQIVLLAYGNQAEIETRYSSCAILVDIPPI